MKNKKLKKYIELSALMCEVQGMVAENQYRIALGQQVAYCEDSFAIVAESIRELQDEENE